MTPFSVRTKQEIRAGYPNAQSVSFIRYVEINVYGDVYRLPKYADFNKQFIKNGLNMSTPYVDNSGVKVLLIAGKLQLTTPFGLTVIWDGYTAVQVLVCDSYAGLVCGLCGNANGLI